MCLAGKCVGGDAGVDSGPPAFTVGGTLTGLASGDSVTVDDNGTDTVVLTAMVRSRSPSRS